MEQIRKLEEVLREREMEEQQPYAYWLNSVSGVGNVTAKQLIEALGSPKMVYHAGEKRLREVVSPKVAEELIRAQNKDVLAAYRELGRKGITMVPFYHPKYPARLIHIADSPFCLYIKGRLPLDERPSLAIVGARNCSEYGRYVAEHFAKNFAELGIQIVSGMAKGIDGVAGDAAMKAGGDTYAVLGCGVDICYPSSNVELYEEICKTGGVISEYLPGTTPSPGLFPARNRIISALADAVLVVEARQKSGTLITVDMALEQGREVYVVPGRITDRLSDGCNRLLIQGANPALSAEQMFAELSETIWKGYKKNVEDVQKDKTKGAAGQQTDSVTGCRLQKLGDKQRALYTLLDFYPISMEQIWLMVQTKEELQGTTLPQIMEMLLELCVTGLAKNEGGYYSCKEPV